LVLKNVLTYVAAVSSVAIQEGVVRDLRVQLFEHLQRLPLGSSSVRAAASCCHELSTTPTR